MRKKRDSESPDDRSERLERNARQRSEQTSEEDRQVDAAVRRSIKIHGA